MGSLKLSTLQLGRLQLGGLTLLALSTLGIPKAIALPAAERDHPTPSCPRANCEVSNQENAPGSSHILSTDDIPEEVLRTELILEGRSPLDGTLLSPEDYAQLQEQLVNKQNGTLPVDTELQSLVFQLKLLNLLKTILPVF